jgi:hypothetical protein
MRKISHIWLSVEMGRKLKEGAPQGKKNLAIAAPSFLAQSFHRYAAIAR